MARRDWNARYAAGEMPPWDRDEPEQRLVELVSNGSLMPARALDVGCGTGTHAVWLASQGFDVVGVDIAPRAIERARDRAGTAGDVECKFEVLDFLAHDAPGGSKCAHNSSKSTKRSSVYCATSSEMTGNDPRYIPCATSRTSPHTCCTAACDA
jgi:SAM-dependent methyltransferase